MRKILLPHRKDAEPTEAELYDDLSVFDLVVAAGSWRLERGTLVAKLRRYGVPAVHWRDSLHWNWSQISSQMLLGGKTQFGIFCAERWQALMMTMTAPLIARLAPDAGQPLVYVDFLDIAPWNRSIPAIDLERKFGALGVTLLKAAVEQSQREGFGGRVGLHALPKAERFYNEIGMMRLGQETHIDDLAYFEFTRESADAFVAGRVGHG